MIRKNFDFVIIGSGIAGLSAALELEKTGSVAVLTKSEIHEGSTHYAQGGIAVALEKTDTPKLHYQDTLEAGDGLCNPEAVSILVHEGVKRVEELIKRGAQFCKSGSNLSFTKEAAHSKRRVLHAKDATGKEIEKTLGNACLQKKNITFFQHTTVTSLLVEGTTCFGCIAIQENKMLCFLSKKLLLASGGCGQLFLHTSNPSVCTGDGMNLAYQAGCRLTDMEFFQFHPTTLHLSDKQPIPIFLISEAVRGEGAILKNKDKQAFMHRYHPKKELAPRDIVARAIFHESIRSKGPVFLDFSPLHGKVETRFPTIYERCLKAKIDIKTDLLPISPAAHYCMGGIHTSLWGETSINNLFAAGETASLGLHGANRLASNSLLDGLVFGHRAALKMSEDASKSRIPHLQDETLKHYLKDDPIPDSILNALPNIKKHIQKTMWENVGIVRNKGTLQEASVNIQSHQPLLEIQTNNPAVLELQHMLSLSQLVISAALEREESRGAHFRDDFPKKSKKWEHRHIMASTSSSALDKKEKT